MLAPDLDRIESQLLGNLVEMHFQRVARLRRAVSPFWTTRRLVRKRSDSLKLVTRHFIRHRLQRAAVERTRNSVATVCATIKKRLKVHPGDRAVVFHTCPDLHQHGMPAAMTVKNFLTRQRHFHWPSGNHRQFTNDNLVIKRITLATKT